ncbi:hypothetical protein HPS12939_1255 [Glaesserella parasuis 12939]|nr:hypothetical protein HPSNAG_1276 [Glaesserella parasuis str. Nagasaki]EQA05351.1 hypothetical protein HPS12939_1255 [Glaesserella parasuis 12939]EQA07375.1 hypothetical protein HPS8415995_2025 [Glaesserella parasuis 84-15995]EQA95457.1 hypothetical protein HPS_0914 [Glaesserella parasuis 29755]
MSNNKKKFLNIVEFMWHYLIRNATFFILSTMPFIFTDAA